ncbi:unnamed protein product [Phyllotreta striolata]|uniref:Uncharacterized protein n=1 Tax=Phyllotreta striolata TaxID=444603 RepID=A0A9N9TRG7_PHYSR|nr:unnamed protein product [Phyllotreta striolata]
MNVIKEVVNWNSDQFPIRLILKKNNGVKTTHKSAIAVGNNGESPSNGDGEGATEFSHLKIIAVRAELGEKTPPHQFNALGSVLGHRIFYTVETEAAEPITCWIVRF